ncbi:Lipopolysaccharide ABC transporter, ATP-binding protein LptB [hydrothermal vent metagenome]|uniref:Lipopolysaccharide ABC transporter, ATP-binding protein LptB n=1 Tax=hydrothermal vent metagenome TaxID=652676 RepID=A0A3B1BPG0_9ZZZZ
MIRTLRARNLVKTYKGRRVVDEVSFSMTNRDIVGLLGPNGAGKTTTFYMTVGLTRSDSGTVSLDDQDITLMPMYQRARVGIGYLPQEPSVFRKLSVLENITAILETLPYSRYERNQKANELLDELGISHLSKNLALSLSGGERRRLEIARALSTRPSFILLDEPFAGIDPIAVNDIQKIVLKLSDKGIGILITDHNVRDTLGITNRAYILNEGKIIEEGTPEAIAASEQARNIYLGHDFSLK